MANTDKTVLQVPMNMSLRRGAESTAVKTGFSSLQEVVRLLLHAFQSGAIQLGYVQQEPVHLSKKAVTRYNNVIRQMKRGNNTHSAENIEAHFRHLKI